MSEESPYSSFLRREVCTILVLIFDGIFFQEALLCKVDIFVVQVSGHFYRCNFLDIFAGGGQYGGAFFSLFVVVK